MLTIMDNDTLEYRDEVLFGNMCDMDGESNSCNFFIIVTFCEMSMLHEGILEEGKY